MICGQIDRQQCGDGGCDADECCGTPWAPSPKTAAWGGMDVPLERSCCAAGTAEVRNVCLASVTPGISDAAAHWKNITGELSCQGHVDAATQERTLAHHGTSTDAAPLLDASRDELRSMAKLAILARFSDAEKQTMDRIATVCPVESTATARLQLARMHGISTKAGAPVDEQDAENLYDTWA